MYANTITLKTALENQVFKPIFIKIIVKKTNEKL